VVIFEQTLRDLLIRTNLVEKRVFLMRAPQVPAEQQKIPYIVFFPVGPTPHHTHNGPLNLIERLYQISVFDESQTRALGIGDALRYDLDTLSGYFENAYIGAMLYETQTWNWETNTRLFNLIQEYTVMYRLLDYPSVVRTRNNQRSKKHESDSANRHAG
jgi:hypothetical protein